MKNIKLIIVLTILFVSSVGLSFYFEDNYEKIIRSLYETLTYHKVSFSHPGKYFHFAGNLFVFSFGLFTTTLYLLLIKQTVRQRFLNIIFAIFLLPISTVLFCYFDGSIKLIECTACDKGTITLNYSDINYNQIFVISLILSFIPTLITEIKKYEKKNRTSKLKINQ